MKFGVSAGMVVIRTNPAVGVIVGISDITGFTDTLTGKIDNIIYKKWYYEIFIFNVFSILPNGKIF